MGLVEKKERSLKAMEKALLIYGGVLYEGVSHEETLSDAQKDYMNANGYAGRTLTKEEYNEMFDKFTEDECFAFGIHPDAKKKGRAYVVGNDLEDLEACKELLVEYCQKNDVKLGTYTDGSHCLEVVEGK